MDSKSPVISRGTLKKGQLSGSIALITGAGSGIGFETARSLIWLGATVIIAEIDKVKGKNAEAQLRKEFDKDSAYFVHTDIGNEKSVRNLSRFVETKFGKLDVLFNNATIAPMGAVHSVDIGKWDASYDVNLRGPVLLISCFLPDMLRKNSGIVVFVPSSGAAPYMGAYEVFKTSQVELCNTLAGELEGTGVITYSIGPGLVKTETAHKAISEIAKLYGKSIDEFYNMNKSVLVSPEEAGAGFAASVASASMYNGLEISSIQALTDIGIQIQEQGASYKIKLTEEEKNSLQKFCSKINATFSEQVDGWYKRLVFEKQWILRDFKKFAGAPPENIIEELKCLESSLECNELAVRDYEALPYSKLCTYYRHQMDLLKNYERNADKLKENLSIMDGWINDINEFKALYCQVINVVSH